MNKKLLDFFWQLAKDNENVRVEAAVGLLDTLIQNNSEEDWDYTFNRLIKGLPSPNGSSRIGFSMALTELLNVRAENITISKYIETLKEHTNASGNLKGHEERAQNFGRLFGIQSLTNSQLIQQKSTTLEDFKSVVILILELAKSKAWLRESCFFSLCLLVEKLPDTLFDSDKAIEFTLKSVDDFKFTTTSEGVALYLLVPQEKRHALPELTNGWKQNDPLAKGNIPLLTKALKEIDTSQNNSIDEISEESAKNKDTKDIKDNKKENNKKQKGNWKARLHFVWTKLALYFQSSVSPASEQSEHKSKKHKSKKSKKDSSSELDLITLDEFWKAVIDEGFFSASASNERKYWGFEVHSLFLQVLTNAPDVKSLFSPNFMRSLVNQLSQKDRYLHKIAQKTVATINEVGVKRPELIPVLLTSLLLSKQGSPNFDQLTKTKTTQKLFNSIQIEQVPSIVNILISVIVNPGETEQKPSDVRRQWALDHLLHLVKTHSNNKEKSTDWIDDILVILIREGYFVSNNSSSPGKDKKRKHEEDLTNIEVNPPFSERTVEQCQQRLTSIITATVGIKRSDKTSWAYRALSTILKFEKDLKLRTPFEGDLLKAKDKAVKTVEKVRKKRLSSPHADNPQLEAFELLFSLVLLQVYSTDSEAASVLEELQFCYNTIIGKSKVEEGADEHEEIDASQVLTEIILSFVSRQSNLLRKISETVWETFSSEITAESFQLLFDVLATKESAEGQEEMFEDDEDEEDEEDEEEEEDDDAEDSSYDGDDDEDDVVDDKVAELERVANKALAEALGINGQEDDADDSDGDDEESMDDEQMMALDGQLATIFKERQKALTEHGTSATRKRSLEAKINMVNFKSRVIDLIEIYVKAQPGSPLILLTVLPLLNILKSSNDKALTDRAHNLLKTKICKLKAISLQDEGRSHGVTPDALVEQIVSVHTLARRSPRQILSQACNQASVFLAKILIIHDPSYVEHVVNIYSQSMIEWLARPSSKTQAALFFEFVNWANAVRGQLKKQQQKDKKTDDGKDKGKDEKDEN
jgi:DNA polymerase phi